MRHSLKLLWHDLAGVAGQMLRRPAGAVHAIVLRPLAVRSGDRLCIFVALAHGGRVSAHALHLARAWRVAGFRLLLVVAADTPEDIADDAELAFADGLIARANQGYDFGAWASAILGMADALATASMLVITNDSLFGPLDGFEALVTRAVTVDADIVGMTESHEITHHFQSYLLMFKQAALRSPAFITFWQSVKTGPRAFVINRYELRLLARMRAAGLRCVALFPQSPGERTNPTLHEWRKLVRAGFPFIKVQLLRDNPYGEDLTGWDAELRARGYDPALVRALIGNVAMPDGPEVRGQEPAKGRGRAIAALRRLTGRSAR